MAEILPFRAWRYNDDLGKKIGELTSPLFDVVSEKQREHLYQKEYNSIHISVPKGILPAKNAGKLLDQWKKEGILKQDHIPSIYVYYQYFTLPGNPKEYCRKGFICFIQAYDWEENVILHHENTMPHSVEDRVTILENTQLNVSATHGLYTDESFELEKYLDESMTNPLYETEDYQGVRDMLGVIQDAKVIKKFIDKIKGQTIILADGHHRYEGSIIYKQRQIEKNDHSTKHGYNYHMMFLTNSEAHDLRILPTHRLIQGIEGLQEEQMLKDLEPYFTIKPVDNPDDINEIILGKQWAFGLIFKENTYKIRLKLEVFNQLNWKFPEEIKKMDLTVLHFFVIEKVLDIPGPKQRGSRHIQFERNFTHCLTNVLKGEAQLALIINDISMEDVKRVCHSGYTMPQKSTYFYPKVICGFLFGSILQHEFDPPPYFSL